MNGHLAAVIESSLPVDRMATAVHEAGHAVIAWSNYTHLRGPLVITADDTGRCPCRQRLASVNQGLARSLKEMGPDAWRSARLGAWLDVEISLAGPLAERRFRAVRDQGRLWPGGVDDHASAIEILSRFDAVGHGTVDDVRVGFMLWSIRRSVVAKLGRPRAWNAVLSIAHDLAAAGALDPDHIEAELTRLRAPRSPSAELHGA